MFLLQFYSASSLYIDHHISVRYLCVYVCVCTHVCVFLHLSVLKLQFYSVSVPFILFGAIRSSRGEEEESGF